MHREAGVCCRLQWSSSQSVPSAPRVPARNEGQLCDLLERLTVVGDAAVDCTRFAGKHQVGRRGEQPFRSDIVRSTSTMDGMPRLRASTQRSVQNSAQRFSVSMA